MIARHHLSWHTNLTCHEWCGNHRLSVVPNFTKLIDAEHDELSSLQAWYGRDCWACKWCTGLACWRNYTCSDLTVDLMRVAASDNRLNTETCKLQQLVMQICNTACVHMFTARMANTFNKLQKDIMQLKNWQCVLWTEAQSNSKLSPPCMMHMFHPSLHNRVACLQHPVLCVALLVRHDQGLLTGTTSSTELLCLIQKWRAWWLSAMTWPFHFKIWTLEGWAFFRAMLWGLLLQDVQPGGHHICVDVYSTCLSL